METKSQSTAIVIGAGLSGLAAARAMRERNISVTVLDAEDRPGEPWRARHPQLRLNIHRHFAQLPGMKMTRRDGTFVGRDTVVRYLEDYAAVLDAPIHFGTLATSVDRAENGWRIQTNKGSYFCEHLIVATGRENTPTLPIWPGLESFGGKLLHTANFGDVRQYDGKKVLVVGAGNSGTDVLNHLSRSNPKKVWVSLRHGPSILPNRIFGFPLHRLAFFFSLLPKWSLDPSFSALQWLSFGNLKRFGLRRHHLGGSTRMRTEGVTFALDNGFVDALKSGRFEAVSETVGFNEFTVKLSDGRKVDADIVICATGYKTGLEILFKDLGVLDSLGRPLFPMGQLDVSNPGLWFTGYTPGLTGFFHAAGISAQHIANQIASANQDVEPDSSRKKQTRKKLVA